MNNFVDGLSGIPAISHPCLTIVCLQVWDYISDGYVHRLIQSSLDGKLVEVPSPQLPGGQHQQLASVSNNYGAPVDGCGKATSSSTEQSSEMTRAMHEDYHMLQVCAASFSASTAFVVGFLMHLLLSGSALHMRVAERNTRSRLDHQTVLWDD